MIFNNNTVLLLIIIGAVIFFLFIMPMVDKDYNNEQTESKVIKEIKEIKENFYSNINFQNNDDKNLVKIDKEKCSRNCCGITQWPVPSEMVNNSIPQDEMKNYIPSNFSCNFGDASGCVCLTQKDSDYLNNHGNNLNK